MNIDQFWNVIEQADGNPLLETYENLTDDKQLQALILLDAQYPKEKIYRHFMTAYRSVIQVRNS